MSLHAGPQSSEAQDVVMAGAHLAIRSHNVTGCCAWRVECEFSITGIIRVVITK